MKNLHIVSRLAALAAFALAGSAFAATPAGCNPDEARNDPAACKREAGAAKVEAKRGNLTTPAPHAADRHATDRCAALMGSEKKDCLARMGTAAPGGPNTSTSVTTSGSVNGGGIIRETTTTTVTPPKP